MKKLTEEILIYLKERRWDNLNPGDLAKSISIESAELLEIFQWSNPTLKEFKKEAEDLEKVRGELADILIYSLELAALLGLDAEDLVRKKLEKIKKKYPAEVFSGIKKNSKEFKTTYLTIKHEHRKNK